VAAISILRLALLAALAVSACAPPPRPGPGAPQEREANRRALMRLDANGDGVIARTEVEEGLRREHAALDVNRDGRYSADEISVENSRRWRAEGAMATPLIDWNQDGTLDFAEFASAPMGLFNIADRDHDGILSAGELQAILRGAPRQPPQQRPQMVGPLGS
jgi:Ca2+-binding EF-hand superfamily protein